MALETEYWLRSFSTASDLSKHLHTMARKRKINNEAAALSSDNTSQEEKYIVY